ncbi:MAG: hypothetical protein HZB14_09055 [Actinobacteria bacterium]|nr:hypothetical protein [Actinomycetota bacterium]
MSDTERSAQARVAHEVLAHDFTDRYLRRSGMSRVAYSVPYDPDDPLCDYDTTWWPAKPNRLSVPIGKLILGRSHYMRGREIDDLFVAPFVDRAADITRTLPDFPVALVNGHDIDLQAALSLLSASIGIARASAEGRFQQTLEETIKVTHGVATRGMAPIAIGHPKLPGRVTFVRLQQLVVNPHLSFPINKQMIESGIPQDFRKRYNAKLRAETVAVAQAPSDHAKGYRTLWSMSPGGTPDLKGEGEHEGKLLTKAIEPATVRLMQEMGCGLLPVYTKFGRGKGETVIELGDIVPPDEVAESTVPTMMADLAEFRRRHGEANVFYEEELALATGVDGRRL